MLNALASLYVYMLSYLDRDDGQDFIEYALIIGLIVIVGIGTMAALGGQISDLWDSIGESLGAAI